MVCLPQGELRAGHLPSDAEARTSSPKLPVGRFRVGDPSGEDQGWVESWTPVLKPPDLCHEADSRSSRDTLPVVARLDRLREFVDRLHPSGLLYATYEHRLIAELDRNRLPRHVAVLADGNRRWARTNAPGQPLVAGYQAGADKLKEFVEWCDEIGIPVVTLWVLSTDNFSRSKREEIEPLLGVIERMVSDLAATRRWRVHPVGALDLLPRSVRQAAQDGRSRHRRHQRHAGQHRRLLRRAA